MQFSGKFGVFTPPLEGSRPPSGKSWIRHCIRNTICKEISKTPIECPQKLAYVLSLSISGVNKTPVVFSQSVHKMSLKHSHTHFLPVTRKLRRCLRRSSSLPCYSAPILSGYLHNQSSLVNIIFIG